MTPRFQTLTIFPNHTINKTENDTQKQGDNALLEPILPPTLLLNQSNSSDAMPQNIKTMSLLAILMASSLGLPAARAQTTPSIERNQAIGPEIYDQMVEAIDIAGYFKNTVAKVYFDDLATWLSNQPARDWPHINRSQTVSTILQTKPYALKAYDQNLASERDNARKIAMRLSLPELQILIDSIGSREKFLALLSVATRYAAAVEHEMSASYYQLERDTHLLRKDKEMAPPENDAFLAELTILNLAAATSLDAFVKDGHKTQLTETLPPYRPTSKMITPAAKSQLRADLIALANEASATPLKAEAMTALPFRFNDAGNPEFREIDPDTPEARVIALAFRYLPALAEHDVDAFLRPAEINTVYLKNASKDGKIVRN